MRLEKPLYTLLLFSLGLTLLTLLQPPETETTSSADSDLLAQQPSRTTFTSAEIHDWRRPAKPVRIASASQPRSPLSPLAAVMTAPTPPSPPAMPYTAELPPPRPTVPDPDLRYLGRLDRDGKTWIFIAQGENSYAVPLGETFEGRWRFDAVQPDRLDLTYLPLHMKSSLTLRDE